MLSWNILSNKTRALEKYIRKYFVTTMIFNHLFQSYTAYQPSQQNYQGEYGFNATAADGFPFHSLMGMKANHFTL